MKLSETMKKGLRLAGREGCLVRWKGGFWTHPDAEVEADRGRGYRVPPEHVGTQTVNALRRRDLLDGTGRQTATLTHEGERALEEIEP